MLPKNLMSEIKQGSVEIAGEDIDLSDLQSAYEKDLDQKSNMTDDSSAVGQMPDLSQGLEAGAMPGMQQPGAPNAPIA